MSRLKDQKVVETVVTEVLVAWNREGARAFSSYFTEDAEFTDVGQLMPGCSEIERLHNIPFTTVLKEAHLELKETKVKATRPDIVSVGVSWETTGHTKPDGTQRLH